MSTFHETAYCTELAERLRNMRCDVSVRFTSCWHYFSVPSDDFCSKDETNVLEERYVSLTTSGNNRLSQKDAVKYDTIVLYELFLQMFRYLSR